MKTLLVLSALVTVQAVCQSALAQPGCPFDASSLQGGQVYYLDGTKPTQLTSASFLEGPQRKPINLYYVVKTLAGERKGALVVKSARLGVPQNDDEPPLDRVGLKRDEVSRRCDVRRVTGFKGSVTTRAYSEYHDLAKESGEYLNKFENGVRAREILRQFHTSYETMTDCRATDDLYRADGRYEARSNRAQFSFDVDTVDIGYSSGTSYVVAQSLDRVRSFIFPSAFAESPKLRERKVEIKHYQTTNGYACIPLQIDVRGAEQVVRVNDLEASRSYLDKPEFRIGPTTGAEP